MADQYGLFWNSVNNDRGYTADSFAEWLNHFFTTGVFSGELQVTAASGMDIKVGSGYANLKGKVRFFDSATKLTLATAGATYPRIDTVVVERNDTDRKISIKVVTGTYNGSSPSPTAPVRSAAIYQIVLAQIYVAAGATKITQANITDTRSNNSVCGIVTGTVKEMDYSQFAAQFSGYYSDFKNSNKADFDTWFNQMKNQLTTDAAGKLQTEIDTIKSTMATTSTAGLMSAEDKSKLDNLQVGGVNLIRSTINDFEHGNYVSFEKNQVDYYGNNDAVKVINIKNGEIGDVWIQPKIQYLRKEAITVGKKVLSFYAKGEGNITVNYRQTNTDLSAQEISMTDEYKKYVIKYDVLEEIKQFDPLYINILSTTGIYIANIKLETGDIATDWTPAPEDTDDQITALDSKIDALNSTTKSFTLSASSWISGRYTISDALITATSNQEVLPASNITVDQMKALQKANIIDSGQSAGSLTLKALGTVPSIDIPIRIIFRGTI